MSEQMAGMLTQIMHFTRPRERQAKKPSPPGRQSG
jgi:hypothetical protein